ncbi:low temperature requirement protein A, partial [Actinoplanes sp. RD1]|uniref:low temperature requirement protein A n=1 Tax=Actinoplanes sp. RD1 TaxID=3064538 RepID=UPI0027410D42
WSWASTTLYANRFDTDDSIFRLLTLAGMAGVVAMAAAVDQVGKADEHWFVLGYVTVRLALVAGYARAWRHVEHARRAIGPYLIGHAVSAVVWLIALAVPAPGRYWLWAAGIALDLIGPAVTARLEHAVPLHMDHLPERFALFIILVLGESVAAVVTGLHDAGWGAHVVGSAALAFVVAVTLWWIYFDLAGGAAKRRLAEEGGEHTRQGVHDFYVYAHLPIAVALAAAAVGLEHAVLHGSDGHLSPGTRWVLALSLAGYLLGAAVLQAGLGRRIRGAFAWPGAGVPLVLLIVLLDLSPAVTLALLAGVLVAGVGAGFALHRSGEVRTAEV